jgi:2-desacetyl-2-hydroxyethyl bacteriochlorophyllide A dehydrogenase
MGIRAVVFPSKNEVTVWDDFADPLLGPGDVEVRSTFTGVSPGTEKNFLTGGNYSPGFPQIPGYQIAGVITRVGDAVSSFVPGQRVYAHLFWGNPYPNHELAWVGSHAALHTGPADGNILPVPDGIPDEEASLLSIASIGLHSVGRGSVGLGDRVLVLGLGAVGLFAGQAIRALGGRAFGFDLVESRRSIADQLGFEATFDAGAADAWDRVVAAGPYDAVIETTAVNQLAKELLERSALRERGRIVMVGGRASVEYPFNVAQFAEAEIVHTMHHTNSEVAEVLRLRAEGRWLIEPLITHRLLPAEVPEFWRGLLAGSQDWLGVVVDWTKD